MRRGYALCRRLRGRERPRWIMYRKFGKETESSSAMPLREVVRVLEYQWANETLEKAQKGHQKSVVMMAHFHLVGYGGLDQSENKAIRWLMRADEHNLVANRMLRDLLVKNRTRQLIKTNQKNPQEED
mmetsp:Transcript_22945/g.34210  ORF Transcript_22945/g.34210 Transcript_22945/m.34210 type:complete len:128 (+) Transcript_22945:2-385(+)